MTYVIMANEDKTQSSTFQKTDYTMSVPAYTHDVDGVPMKILLEYEAVDWNDAMRISNEFFGFEPYVPMED